MRFKVFYTDVPLRTRERSPDLTGLVPLERDSRDAAVFRGGLVYGNYCVTCHGINADGNGRAARLHNPRPANLRASDKNDAYIKLIVTRN